tara:strand:+ start:201 stop:392 length:192 start_codon:yes stop_codon:yes gene_type:complete
MSKIAILSGLKLIQIREPQVLEPKSKEVIVQVERAGICGTDLALFAGDYKVDLPLVLGEEVDS